MDAKIKMKPAQLKKAFTLIEVVISIILLGIIFTFLYTTIDSLKQQNNHYIKKADSIKKEKKIFALFNLDIAQAIGSISITHASRYDLMQFKTKHSIYEIIEPSVLYFVSKKEHALVRVESLEPFKLDNKEQIVKTFLYADILATNTTSFKISNKKAGFITILLRVPTIKPMLLQIPIVSSKGNS